MRVLAITKIFPNSLEPLSSPFNVQQFRALAKRCELRVLEAIPYFPASRLTGKPPRAAMLTALPREELVRGILTIYMRQLYLPRIGLAAALPLYLASLVPYVRIARDADVILGTWAYPDGCAAVLLAQALKKPCVVKVHGSDINVVAKRPSARAALTRLLPRVDALVTVSNALGDECVGLGVDPARVHLVRNGVDTSVFFHRDKREARRSLGLAEDRPLVLFVGRLEPQKGLVELLDAWSEVRKVRRDAVLALIGEGVLRTRVDADVRALGGAVIAPGPKPLAEVAQWMAASDLLVLPSWNEGTPNVVLESLASGRPAVGTRVGGIPDVLADPRSGLLVPVRDAAALGGALVDALSREWPPDSVSACATGSWDESGAALHDVLWQARGQKL